MSNNKSLTNKPTPKLTVVKPPQPPAVRTIAFPDFDKLVMKIDWLAAILDQIVKADHATLDAAVDEHGHPKGSEEYKKFRERSIKQIGFAEKLLADVREKWGKIEKTLAQCRADFAHYHHRSMFDDQLNMKNPGIIAEKVADMLGAFPNAGPHDPETYVPRLIEEIALTGHFPVIIEGAMRWIVRNKNFPPTVAEMRKAMDEEASRWRDRWPVIDTVEDNEEGDALAYWIKELPETIAWAKLELEIEEKPPEAAP